jgi:hypothetical protein
MNVGAVELISILAIAVLLALVVTWIVLRTTRRSH